MTRKTETVRPFHRADTCQFKFAISVFNFERSDGYWYIRGGIGCVQHSNHLRFSANQLPNPVNLLTQYEHEIINKVNNNGRTPPSITMQILNNDTDDVLNRQQVMYLHAKGKVEKALKENLSRHPTTAESTIQFLKSVEGAKFYCLYHRVDSRLHLDTTKGRPKTKETKEIEEVTNMGYYFEYKDSDGKIIVDHVEFSSNFKKDLEQFASVHRESLRIDDSQKMLIACAWVLPHEIKQCGLYPECLFADVTAGTNKEQRPFFHLCGKDNCNKVFTILRAWLPSECAWVFHWINHKVLVSFYPNTLLKKIRIYITDGDPQEMSQTDSFIRTYAPNCIRIQCGWHITYKI